MSPKPSAQIPVLRPRLPDAEALLPYLKRIDAARTYTNWGPLVREYEQRLAKEIGVPNGALVSASSATAGLAATALTLAGRATAERPLAIVPSYTFVASAVALELCGYQCFLADVDPQTWSLDPQALRARLKPEILERTAIVMPVAPYGRAVDQSPWKKFADETGIAVVIDAAASFEQLCAQPSRLIGSIPVVISLHATKALAAGEGGAIGCTDAALVERIGTALNFGFHGTRESISPSLNGKMSEYHAAVGLAELDGWKGKHAALQAVADAYRKHFANERLTDHFVGAPDIASCYALFRCDNGAQAARIQEALTSNRVDFRLWYGTGLHDQRQFRSLVSENLAVTRDLAPRIIGLPVAVDLPSESIRRVVAAVAQGMRAGR